MSVEEQAFFEPGGAENAGAAGGGHQAGDAPAGQQEAGGAPAGQQQDGGGAAGQQEGGGATGQQLDEEEPSSPKGDTTQGESERAGGIKQEPADKDAGAGNGSSDFSGDDDPKYPPRPENWIHQYLLIYCFIGRPSSSEDADLATARKTSGPSDRPNKRKKGAPANSNQSDEVEEVQAPPGNLDSKAIRMFAGAGQAQSRAQVQKEQAAVAAASAKAAQRQAQMADSVKLVKAVEALSAAVSAKSELDVQANARAREGTARDRKNSAVTSLRGELEFSDPESPRYAQLREEIRVLFATPVSAFMDAPASAAAGRAAAAAPARVDPSSTASTPGPTLLAAATPARTTLPGFAGVGGVGAGVGGGAASSASGVTGHVSV